ncbi:hypothetical protein [Bacteroides gallinarum]|uniref:hypothetical protein n=2 Tax=Bacteroides gallinarum TaxID=376806 RepID=UPI000469B1FF|nr:hypothetical protein [Bacteroides gallinarum]
MMLNTKKRPLIAAVILLTSLGVTTSCIDNSYDLNKDIDMTISAGGEHLAIPVGYTERITLDKIIELNSEDDLKVLDNGEYHLLKEDEIIPSTTTVKQITVNGSSDNPIEKITAANEHSSIENNVITTNIIPKKGKIKATATQIDKAVIEIGELQGIQPTDLLLKFKLTGDLSYQSIKASLVISFPYYLQFMADPKLNKENNILTLELTESELKLNQEYIYPLKLTGYKFATQAGTDKGKYPGEQHSITINDDVTITGKTEVTVNSAVNGALLEINPTVELTPMPIKSIRGVIKPEINETVTTVKLENLPDFLSDDAVELDITNPLISFIANNPLQTPIVLNGIMYGEKGGSTIEGSTVKIGNESKDKNKILLAPGDNTIILSRTGKSDKENSQSVQNIQVSDINNLIKKIPDVVNVVLNPIVENEQYYTVELKDYEMTGNYDIDIPLNFGSALKIVYDETIDNFDLDLEDVDIKKAILSINAVNTIPLAMEIKDDNVSAVDVNGNVIKDIDVTVEGTITESKDGKTEVTSTLNINLDETAEGAISKLDGLKLKVTAVPGQATDVQLLSSQWLQLKDMKLKIPNGIKVDLN